MVDFLETFFAERRGSLAADERQVERKKDVQYAAK